MRAAFTAGVRPSVSSGGKTKSAADASNDSSNEHPVTTRLNWHVLGGNNQNRIGANCGLCVYDETLPDGTTRQRALLFDAGVLAGDPRAAEDPALVDCDNVIPDLTPYLYKKTIRRTNPKWRSIPFISRTATPITSVRCRL